MRFSWLVLGLCWCLLIALVIVLIEVQFRMVWSCLVFCGFVVRFGCWLFSGACCFAVVGCCWL